LHDSVSREAYLEIGEITIRMGIQPVVDLIPAHRMLDYIQIVWDILCRHGMCKDLLAIEANVAILEKSEIGTLHLNM
jgi:hypothetical protein